MRALCLALALASTPAFADTIVRDGGGNPVIVKGYVTSDGKQVPASAPYSPPVTRLNTSGTITTANTAQQALASNTARRGGYCQSDPRNNDYLELAFGVTASTTLGAGNDCTLTPGGTCPLTIAGGVFQGAVSVTSATAGTAFNCTEAQ